MSVSGGGAGAESVGGGAGAVSVRDDEGSATVLVMAACLLGVFAAGATATIGGAVVARHRAQSSADLAALAAADVLIGRAGGAPCSAAAAVVAGAGARLVSCTVGGADVLVRTSVSWVGGSLAAGLGPAQAQARAGPADGR